MKCNVTAIAPTVYQLNSVRAFGESRQLMNGSHIFQQEFKSIKAAKEYLKERAIRYFESTEELKTALSDIRKLGRLEIDAVVGNINLL